MFYACVLCLKVLKLSFYTHIFIAILIMKLNDPSIIFLPHAMKTDNNNVDRVKRIWYLSPMRAAKFQASLRIRAVSPELSLLAHTSSESRGTFRQKARSLAPLNGWACAVEICHDGMLEDTNSLDGAHVRLPLNVLVGKIKYLFSNLTIFIKVIFSQGKYR